MLYAKFHIIIANRFVHCCGGPDDYVMFSSHTPWLYNYTRAVSHACAYATFSLD